MGKMEAAGDIARRLEANGWTDKQASSSGSLRKEIRKQISRIYLNFERPGEDRIALLVEDALRLWKDIPPERLTEAVEAAIIEAGSFPATTGLVAKVWLERKRKPLEYQVPEWTGPTLPAPARTPEEIEEWHRQCREIIDRLEGGSQGMGMP